MFRKILLFTISGSLLFLSACTVCGKTEKPAEKKSAEILPPEKRYLQCLLEKDPAKRNASFKKLLPELVQEAEDKKNLKAALLAGCIYEGGQGVKPNLIQAARYYRMAADGGSVPGKLALAEFWYRNGMFPEETIQQLRSIPSFEKNPKALYLLGAVYYSRFRQKEGFVFLKQAYALSEKNPNLRNKIMDVIHTSALDCMRGENQDAAMEELKREAELDKENPMTFYLMGLVEIQRKNERQAEAYLNESLRKNPGLPFAYSKLALLKAAKGNLEEAIDDAKVAYAVSGKRMHETKILVDLLISGGRYDEIIRLMNIMLREKPDDIYAHLIRGSTYMFKRDYPKAAADLEHVAVLPEFSGDSFILDSLGAAYSGMDQMAKAAVCYEKNLKNVKNPVVMLNLAEVYLVQGRYEDALKLLNHEVLKNAKDLMTRTIVPYLRACAFYAMQRNEEGLKEENAFRAVLPEYRKNPECKSGWDTAIFRRWLGKAKLPSPVLEKLKTLTELFPK